MKVSFLICNSGDGSNHLEWFSHPLTREQLNTIEEQDYECYSSGGGIQYKELEVQDNFFEVNEYLYPSTFEGWYKGYIREAK